ncbi:MAG: thiamine biosynthesis protein ThiS [Bacteroidetes bacterium CG12_big_fil_rev_8_21_14_0_65_60_17]|nr:MAG: thiamine biosynthesis protein ThiS [Bacteroidetes bacterium CG12_big_fil_rev_8_21_14_0_65_60_17]
MSAPHCQVNGEKYALRIGTTISDLIRAEGLNPESVRGVAVALNNTVIRKNEWSGTVVNEGDRIEIVTAQQGG